MDIDIIEWARAKSAIVVTLDADFHTMLGSDEGLPLKERNTTCHILPRVD